MVKYRRDDMTGASAMLVTDGGTFTEIQAELIEILVGDCCAGPQLFKSGITITAVNSYSRHCAVVFESYLELVGADFPAGAMEIAVLKNHLYRPADPLGRYYGKVGKRSCITQPIQASENGTMVG